MDSIGDLIGKKVQRLDLDEKQTELQMIQQELDRLYDKEVQVVKINLDKSLFITTKNPILAGEIRYQQTEILHVINSVSAQDIIGIRIAIN